MSMVDQRLLQMQLDSMQTVRALLEKAFTVRIQAAECRWRLDDCFGGWSFFLTSPQGEKNNGFDVLYHNMKHGQISSKELTDFIRERWEASVVFLFAGVVDVDVADGESPDRWSVRLGQTLRFSHQSSSLPWSRPALLFFYCVEFVATPSCFCCKSSCMPDCCSHRPPRQFAYTKAATSWQPLSPL